jgi:hypothetical protein
MSRSAANSRKRRAGARALFGHFREFASDRYVQSSRTQNQKCRALQGLQNSLNEIEFILIQRAKIIFEKPRKSPVNFDVSAGRNLTLAGRAARKKKRVDFETK